MIDQFHREYRKGYGYTPSEVTPGSQYGRIEVKSACKPDSKVRALDHQSYSPE